jgi:hypothetical protein
MPPDDQPAAPPIAADRCEEQVSKKPRIRFKFVGLTSAQTVIQDAGANNSKSSCILQQNTETDLLSLEEEDEAVATQFPPPGDMDGGVPEGRTTPKGRKRKLGELLVQEDFLLTEDSEAESSRSPGGPQTDLGSDRESDTEPADPHEETSGQPSGSNNPGYKKAEVYTLT